MQQNTAQLAANGQRNADLSQAAGAMKPPSFTAQPLDTAPFAPPPQHFAAPLPTPRPLPAFTGQPLAGGFTPPSPTTPAPTLPPEAGPAPAAPGIADLPAPLPPAPSTPSAMAPDALASPVTRPDIPAPTAEVDPFAPVARGGLGLTPPAAPGVTAFTGTPAVAPERPAVTPETRSGPEAASIGGQVEDGLIEAAQTAGEAGIGYRAGMYGELGVGQWTADIGPSAKFGRYKPDATFVDQRFTGYGIDKFADTPTGRNMPWQTMVSSQAAYEYARQQGIDQGLDRLGIQFETTDPRSPGRTYDVRLIPTRPHQAPTPVTEIKAGKGIDSQQFRRDIRAANAGLPVDYQFAGNPIIGNHGPDPALTARLTAANNSTNGNLTHAVAATAGAAGGWAGAAAGGWGGVKLGTAAGAAVGGPIGAAVGGVAGGLIGAVGGGFAAGWGAESAVRAATNLNSHKAPISPRLPLCANRCGGSFVRDTQGIPISLHE